MQWPFAAQLRAAEPKGSRTETGSVGDAPGPDRYRRQSISAILRRSDNLRPADASLESFVRWLALIRENIADPEELLAQHEWMCRQMALHATEDKPEPVPVPVARDPEFEPEPESAAVPDQLTLRATPVVTAPARVTLRAQAAAERFVEWVRLADRCGDYSSAEFTELYREHCEAEDLVILGDNVLRPALLHLDGVSKFRTDTGRRHGDRSRNFRWAIKPLATVAEIPWKELPDRRRVA